MSAHIFVLLAAAVGYWWSVDHAPAVAHFGGCAALILVVHAAMAARGKHAKG